ncbi:MAG: winged helix-turn-helix domain-containing protein, partial [Myxococcota bacterium]
ATTSDGRHLFLQLGRWKRRRGTRSSRRVDLARGTVDGPSGRMYLTAVEVGLVRALHHAKGRVVDRSTLKRAGWTGGASDRALTNAMHRLRSKLGQDALRTTRGSGYQLVTGSPPYPTPPLPEPSSPLFGREPELAAILDRLDDGAHLVSLVGAAGIGKTRLAVRAASMTADRFCGGVWLADLTQATDEDDVIRLLTQDLQVPDGTRDALVRTLKLRGPSLVVVDSFEGVVDHAASTVGYCLREAPESVFVVTSRERLRIREESVLQIGPLPKPDAIALFESRACQAGATVRASDHVAIERIVEQLDGIPLALELAAARSPQLGIRQVEAMLSDRFALLVGGPRDAPPRHAMWRAALAWSWRLLDGTEQQLMTELSVFVGGFDRAAAEAVATVSDVTEKLTSLVDKSLIQLSSDGGRYSLFASVRLYAAQFLSNEAIRKRHATYYASLGSEEVQRLRGRPGEIERLERMKLERENLRTAFDFARAAGPPRVAVESALALAKLGWDFGPIPPELARCNELIDAFGEILPTRLLARLVYTKSYLAIRTGRNAQAIEAATQARMLAESLGATWLARAATVVLSGAYRQVGELDRAREEALVGQSLAEQEGELCLVGRSLHPLERWSRVVGDFRQAVALGERMLQIGRDTGDLLGELVALSVLGTSHSELLNVEMARFYYERALELCKITRSPTLEAPLRNLLGIWFADRGAGAEARREFGICLDLSKLAGDERVYGPVTLNIATLAVIEDQLVEARHFIEQAQTVAMRSGARSLLLRARILLAEVSRRGGDLDAARRQLDVVFADPYCRRTPRLSALADSQAGLLALDEREASKAERCLHSAEKALASVKLRRPSQRRTVDELARRLRG